MTEIIARVLLEEWKNQSLPRHKERVEKMITFRKNPGEKVLELGGGSNPDPIADCNVDVRMCYDGQGKPTVHFTADFEQPLPIQDNEWDSVISKYCLEHLPWTKVKPFLKEVLRITKPGGKVVFVTANTEAQMEWIKNHPNGWDNKGAFDAASEVIFGSMDYPENTHKLYLSPPLAMNLFQDAGFENILTQSYNDRGTDLIVQATKPVTSRNISEYERQMEQTRIQSEQVKFRIEQEGLSSVQPQHTTEIKSDGIKGIPREVLFGKDYFNGGKKFGGYAREGYWDFPCHEITFRHILSRKPVSVIEIGAGRNYIVKRLQDAGIHSVGIEISKHCQMTRVADSFVPWDICKTPWPVLETEKVDLYAQGDGLGGPNIKKDLIFSIATLEHIPEEYLLRVIEEMTRVARRGLHGVDFGEKDDGFDKTHCSLKSKKFWEEMFAKYAPGWPVEIVDKEELERLPQGLTVLPGTVWDLSGYYNGDGKIKLEIGSFTVMNHHGWVNLDIHDLTQFAQVHNYRFQRCDVKQGIPYQTGSVHMAHMSHVLEHFTQTEGLSILRELRRIIRPDGVIRIAVPDAGLLINKCQADSNGLTEYDEINDGCANAPTQVGKLWELLFSGHQTLYDRETLCLTLKEAGFVPKPSFFRETSCGEYGKQIRKETLDVLPCLSLFCEAVP